MTIGRIAIRCSCLPACVAMLAGCTIVRVEGDNPRISAHLGVLRIEPTPNADLIVIRSTGLGLVPGLNGATLGFREETIAMVGDPERCQIVIFEHSGGGERLARLLNDTQQICQIGD